jgi:hypothetical protein
LAGPVRSFEEDHSLSLRHDLKVGNCMLRHTEFLLTDFGESEMAIKDFCTSTRLLD